MVTDNMHNKNKMPFASLEGKILVASPTIGDPIFGQALVYICMHDENGAIGVIINNKVGTISDGDLKSYITEVSKIFSKTFKAKGKSKNQEQVSQIVSKKNYPVLLGGPAFSDRIVVLSLSKEQEQFFDTKQHLTFYTDMVTFLKDYFNDNIQQNKLLFAKGIAAWDSAQLDSEVSDNNWFVVPASVDLLFSQKQRSKWNNIIKNMGLSKFYNLVSYSGQV